MKCKRSAADDEVSEKCNEENLVMAMSNTVEHPNDSKVGKDEVGERVHHLSDVSCQPVIFLTPGRKN